MRVLTVGNMYPPHHFGGYELGWRAAVEGLRDRGHDVRVLTTDVDTGTTEPDAPDVHRELRWHLRDGRFERLGVRGRAALARHNHRVLDHHLDELRPDVVSWWSMGGLTLTLLETVRRRGLPAVAFVHDDWLDYGPLVDPWLRVFASRRRRYFARPAELVTRIPARVDLGAAARYVFISEFTRRHALSLGLDLRSTGVVHSGIHPEYLEPAPAREWGWRLLYVGRLDPRKGVDTALAALAHLPEATLRIVGGGDAREEARLRGEARRLGVADRVEFAGHRDRHDLLDAYAEADAVIFPVRWDEPWGLVPLEAMARRRPVVATGRGGSAEYLRDEENCLLFEADDDAALAAALRRLATDPVLRARLRTTGTTTAAQHTEAVLSDGVERELLEAAAGAGSPRGRPPRR